MAGNRVEFKANANGLVVVFDKSESFDSICAQIGRKLESGGFFFQTRYLSATYKGRKLTAEEEGQISRLMAEKTGARTVLFEIDKDFEREYKRAERIAQNNGFDIIGLGDLDAGDDQQPAARGAFAEGGPPRLRPQDTSNTVSNIETSALSDTSTTSVNGGAPAASATGVAPSAAAAAAAARKRYTSKDLDECITKYYRGTLRSGRLVSYDGNVVIIGDINPGAEVEATGNIIVLGNVRGIVHAGAGGNKDASVIALNFAPTQLRIADVITARSERRSGSGAGSNPEIAYLKGDAIVFERLGQTR